jgi:AcrR family transcriptional regulator
MARTQALDFDSKREAIMKKAASLFALKGFNGASISDLSKSCGVSKSLIYHYYAAKEDILFDVMNNHIEELIAVVQSTPLTSSNSKENFASLTEAILTCYAGAEDEQKVLLYELGNLQPDQRKEIVAKQRSIISRFESLYSEIFPELKLNKPLLRSKIMLFFGMINWTHTWFNPRGKISRQELAKLASELVT